MDVSTLLERGLVALRPTLSDLNELEIEVDDYVFALFDGGRPASNGECADDGVVAVVANETTLTAILTRVVPPEGMAQLAQWFHQVNPGRTRIVAVTKHAIQGVLVDRAMLVTDHARRGVRRKPCAAPMTQ